jgi:hypothetical protein
MIVSRFWLAPSFRSHIGAWIFAQNRTLSEPFISKRKIYHIMYERKTGESNESCFAQTSSFLIPVDPYQQFVDTGFIVYFKRMIFPYYR